MFNALIEALLSLPDMALKRKGISLLTDETAKKNYVQIDLEMLLKEPEAVEEYLDCLIAESRRNEPSEDPTSAHRG